MSKFGLMLAGLYVLIGGYLILTQGLFGESFIALILGLPWVLIPAYLEFFGLENNIATMTFTLLPMVLNILVLYWIGALLGRLFSRSTT